MNQPTKGEIVESMAARRLHELLEHILCDVIFETQQDNEPSIDAYIDIVVRKTVERLATALLEDKVIFVDTGFFRRRQRLDTDEDTRPLISESHQSDRLPHSTDTT